MLLAVSTSTIPMKSNVRTALPFAGYEPVFSLALDGDHSTFYAPQKFWGKTGPDRKRSCRVYESQLRDLRT